MTQAASPVTTALTGDDIALAIAARVTAKRNLELALANHQSMVTKIQGQHTAIQAEIDSAKSAYESGASWTAPADSVLNQLQPSQNQRIIPPRGPIGTRNNPPSPPAAGAAAANVAPPTPAPNSVATSAAGGIAGNVAVAQ